MQNLKTAAPSPPDSAARPSGGGVVFLLFFSGFAGLVYEVLWLRTLQTIFGSTAYATASVLGVFFAGLSLGNAFWDARCQRLRNPLRTFALLEFAIGASAVLYFALLPLYEVSISWLYLSVGQNEAAFFVAKLLLAAAIVFPPSFFMGGTLPVVIEYFLRQSKEPGTHGSLIYGVNTIGAALGALSAGFFFPIVLGYRNSYFLAVAVSVTVGCLVYLMSSRSPPPKLSALAVDVPSSSSTRWQASSFGRIECLAFLSGFLTLGLEVLWTHLFAQVLNNSVYTFSVVLVTYILALALGSFIAHLLCLLSADSEKTLWVLLLASGVLVGVSPFVFFYLTDGLDRLTPVMAWNRYIAAIFQKTGLAIGLSVVAMGTVFPYLLKVSEELASEDSGEGKKWKNLMGRLLAINTLGSILGSLLAGFVLIRVLGSWSSILLMTVLYFVAAFIWIPRNPARRLAYRLLPAAGALVFLTVADPSDLPIINLEKGEVLIETWEGSYGVVSVVDSGDRIRLKSNNHFYLGGIPKRNPQARTAGFAATAADPGAGDLEAENSGTDPGGSSSEVVTRSQMTDFPVMMHSDPSEIFFEGMGTGVTAGASLKFSSTKSVVVTELVPEVIEAAEKHFGEFHSLFEDPRVRVIAEDARNYLVYSPETFDLIISDLFFPWQRGSGSLYSLEHYRNVKRRLKPGGLFVQWLPAYQMSETEFSIIAKTMLEVFPQVTLWRGNFDSRMPIVGLFGASEVKPLAAGTLAENFVAYLPDSPFPESAQRFIPFLFYAGNIGQISAMFDEYPVNRDDRPYIEYVAPVSYQYASLRAMSWFSSTALADFFHRVFAAAAAAPEADPHLAELDSRSIDFVYAGRDFFSAEASRQEGNVEEHEKYVARLCDRLGEPVCNSVIRTLSRPVPRGVRQRQPTSRLSTPSPEQPGK